MKLKGFFGLTPTQQGRYRDHLKSLGADPDEALKIRLDTGTAQRPVYLTSDLQKTAIIPNILVVRNVGELKKHGGVPDLEIRGGITRDDNIPYPPAWDGRGDRLISRSHSVQQLSALLTQEQRKNIRAALRAWMIGDSEKVRSYEAILNAVHFPQYVAVFSGDTLCVKAGNPVIIAPPTPGSYTDSNPYKVSFAEVCIEYGGQIQFQVPTSMTVVNMTRLPQGASCDC